MSSRKLWKVNRVFFAFIFLIERKVKSSCSNSLLSLKFPRSWLLRNVLTVGIFCFHLTSVCAHIFGSTAHWISMTRPESYLTYTVYAGKIVCAVWKGRNEPERRQIFEARTDPEHATSFKLKLSALFFFSSASIRILKVFSLSSPPISMMRTEGKEDATCNGYRRVLERTSDLIAWSTNHDNQKRVGAECR